MAPRRTCRSSSPSTPSRAPTRKCSSPVRQRSSSTSSLHPLTRRHNKSLAQSTGTLFVKHDENAAQAAGCRCRACRSPRGTWRNDSLQVQVSEQLSSIRSADQAKDAEGGKATQSSPSRRRPEKLLVSSASVVESPDSPLSLNAMRTMFEPGKRPRPKSAPCGPRAPAAAVQRTLQSDSPFLDGAADLHEARSSRPSRPASASSSGRQKTQHDLRTEAVLERKHLMQENFVQRCRSAWDVKSANIEFRQKESAARLAASLEAHRFESTVKKTVGERLRQWSTIIHVIHVQLGFQELVISGRLLLLASLGGDALQKQLSNMRITALQKRQLTFRSAPSEFSDFSFVRSRRLDSMLSLCSEESGLSPSGKRRSCDLEPVRRASVIAAVFPQLRRMSMRSLPRGEEDMANYLSQVQAEVTTRASIWKMWNIPLMCIVAVARLKHQQSIRKSIQIVKSFSIQIARANSNNNSSFDTAIKHRFTQIRFIQRTVKLWIRLEGARHEQISRIFVAMETRTIKRQWADEDRKVIREGLQKLSKVRIVKERKLCERMIKLSKERYARYTKPKTDFDVSHLRENLAQNSVSMLVRNLSIYHIYKARKLFIKSELADHKKLYDEYMLEMLCWRDIDQAVKIIDPTGGNTEPVPIPPPPRFFSNLIEEKMALLIVVQIRQWCDANKELLEAIFLKRLPKMRRNRTAKKSSLDCPLDCPASARALGRYEMMEYMERMPKAHHNEGCLPMEYAILDSAISCIVRAAVCPKVVAKEAKETVVSKRLSAKSKEKGEFSDSSENSAEERRGSKSVRAQPKSMRALSKERRRSSV